MSFFGIMAVPMAMNMLGGLFSPSPPTFNSTYFNSMNSSLSSTLADNSQAMDEMWEKRPEPKQMTLDFEVPDFPDEPAAKFEQMQQTHEGERTTFLNQMKSEVSQMKEEFFAKNHYETKQGADGKPQVVVDKEGKPVVKPGAENPQQKMARQTFEVTQKAEMFTKHASEKQEFAQQQKSEVMTFLDGNKFQMHNPGIQGELQKLLVDGQKKGLKLQETHEEEFYKIDLPPVEGIQAKADEKIAQYREMVEEQMVEEQNSPEAKQLADYQQDLVALLDAKRAEAREEKRANMFLIDPRRMMQGGSTEDIATSLPMNMVVALENFGINQLPS